MHIVQILVVILVFILLMFDIKFLNVKHKIRLYICYSLICLYLFLNLNNINFDNYDSYKDLLNCIIITILVREFFITRSNILRVKLDIIKIIRSIAIKQKI